MSKRLWIMRDLPSGQTHINRQMNIHVKMQIWQVINLKLNLMVLFNNYHGFIVKTRVPRDQAENLLCWSITSTLKMPRHCRTLNGTLRNFPIRFCHCCWTWQLDKSPSQITKTIRTPSITHRSHTYALGRYLIDVDSMVFAIWVATYHGSLVFCARPGYWA